LLILDGYSDWDGVLLAPARREFYAIETACKAHNVSFPRIEE
jgi:hypothetical protein